MANEQKKVSELPISNSVSGSDRVVVLKDPSGSPSTRTITVSNLLNSLPAGNSTVAGVYKVGSGLYVSSNSISVNSSALIGDGLYVSTSNSIAVNTAALVGSGLYVSSNSITLNTSACYTFSGSDSFVINSSSYAWKFANSGDLFYPTNVSTSSRSSNDVNFISSTLVQLQYNPDSNVSSSYANNSNWLYVDSLGVHAEVLDASGALTSHVDIYSNGNIVIAGNTQITFGDSTTQNTAWTGSYTPANSSNWTGSPPTTIQDALDRLAAAMVILGQTP